MGQMTPRRIDARRTPSHRRKQLAKVMYQLGPGSRGQAKPLQHRRCRVRRYTLLAPSDLTRRPVEKLQVIGHRKRQKTLVAAPSRCRAGARPGRIDPLVDSQRREKPVGFLSQRNDWLARRWRWAGLLIVLGRVSGLVFQRLNATLQRRVITRLERFGDRLSRGAEKGPVMGA